MQILVQAVWVRTRFSFSNLLRGDADAAGCGPRLQGEVSTGFPLKVPKGLKPELPTSRPSSVACSYWSSLLPCLTTCLWLPRVTFQINHLFCTQVLALTWEHPRKTLSFTDEPHWCRSHTITKEVGLQSEPDPQALCTIYTPIPLYHTASLVVCDCLEFWVQLQITENPNNNGSNIIGILFSCVRRNP